MTKRALHATSPASLVSLAVLFLVGLPAAALASDDAHGGDSSELIYTAINLAILLAVLVYFARKPIQQFFASRRAQIQGDLDSAASLLSEAEQRNSEIQRRLVDLESQIEEIRETTRRRAEEESEHILAEAHKTAERIQTDAAAAVDQELLRAQRELRAEAADLALQLASDMLREQVADSDRERLLDEFITRVEPGSEAGR
jgi:F-type H+-transporting ATPase subunit b